MTTRSSRFRFVLVDEGAQLPARTRDSYRRPQSWPEPSLAGLAALVEALAQLSRRGPEPGGWAPPLGDNPLGFLLESIRDAVLVRQGGDVLYRNRAALHLPVIDRPPVPAERVRVLDAEGCARWYERRCLRLSEEAEGLVIEILSELFSAQESRE